MAQLRCFSLIGDSNVKRNVSKTNIRACPQLSGCQILQCQNLALFDEAVSSIRKESNVCIVSCVTNFLTSSDEDSMVSKRVEPVIEQLLGVLSQFCVSNPATSVFIAPPMYRQNPLWYREGLPEILTCFSAILRERPPNLHLLQSFPTPDFEQDGIHLTAYSGLEFMIHLFDTTLSMLEQLEREPSCEEHIPAASEATRLLEDRMMVLEQDHRRLNKDVEYRAAIDAELHDFHENVSTESYLMVTGLPKILGLSTREWQDQAKKDMAPYLRDLMGRDIPIDFISNATGPRPDAPVRYNVKLHSATLSKEVRTKFGAFYGNGRDERPDRFKPISIRNLVTQCTRVRIAVLQVIGKRYRDSNQGSMVKIISYDPRPLLRITPPKDASSRKVSTYTYIEAIKKFPTNFSKPDLDFILSKVGYKQKGQLRSLFVCLNDDMLPHPGKTNKSGSNVAGSHAGTARPNSETVSADIHVSADDSIAIADNPDVAEMDQSPPMMVPPPSGSRPVVAQPSGRTSTSGRTQKRGAPSPASSQPEKTSRV